MANLRKVAETLAAHGQHDLAREVAGLSLQLKQAADKYDVGDDYRALSPVAKKLLPSLKAMNEAIEDAKPTDPYKFTHEHIVSTFKEALRLAELAAKGWK